MCSRNTDADNDYSSVAVILIAASASTTGASDADCCCTAQCLASVCGAAGFTNTKDGFAAIAGTTEAACCDADVTGMCSGNTDAATHYSYPEGGVLIAASASTTGASHAACCTAHCRASHCAAGGLRLKADFATIGGTTEAACCDVIGRCNGNALATSDFDCSATSIDIAAASAAWAATLCNPTVKETISGETISGAATATVAASALALVAPLL
jgi:hypothetical protein